MDLTTCHKNTLEIGVYVFFYLIKQHSKFVTQLTGALYVHPLWFYKHQHDNPFRSKLSVACQRWWFLLHTHPVSWNCAYPLRMELSDGGSFPNLVLKCRWTIVTDRHSWNIRTQNAISFPFAAILVNCAPSGEMLNYCTPHIIKENFENFLIHRCNYVPISQVYCVWQVVKNPQNHFEYPVFYRPLQNILVPGMTASTIFCKYFPSSVMLYAMQRIACVFFKRKTELCRRKSCHCCRIKNI